MSESNRNYKQVREGEILELLREHYESKGYSFIKQPYQDLLPEFIGVYSPDAIALKGAEKIAIEIKSRQTSSTEKALKEISKLFVNQDEWKFRTYYSNEIPNEPSDLRTSDYKAILNKYEEIQKIAEAGYLSETFVLLWTILEAIAHSSPFSKNHNMSKKALKPRTVVNSLEEMGLIPNSDAMILRSLVNKRNLLVHGDFSQTVTEAEVNIIRRAIETALDRFEDT